MGWGAAIGGALSAAGGLAANAQSAKAVRVGYKHRYQWQMEDMRKAGLNPMLAISHAPPVPQKPDVANVGDLAVKGAAAGASARQAYALNKANVENVKANTAKTRMDTAKSEAEALLTQAQAAALYPKLPYSAGMAWAESDRAMSEAKTAAMMVSKIGLDIAHSEQDLEHNAKMQPLLRQMESALIEAKESELPLRNLVELFASKALEGWDYLLNGSMKQRTVDGILDMINQAGQDTRAKALALLRGLARFGSKDKEGKW